jgi:exopolysaccharide biosynthesis polyprenyl glycosylphosphotransferase
MSHNGAYGNRRKKILFVGDLFLNFFAFTLAVSAKLSILGLLSVSALVAKVEFMVIVWMLVYPITFYIFELYNIERRVNSVRLFIYISSASVVAAGISWFLSYLIIPNNVIGRIILFLHIVLSIILVFTWRKIFEKYRGRKGCNERKTLIIGDSPVTKDIVCLLEKLVHSEPKNYDVIKEYSENPGKVSIKGKKNNLKIYDLVRSCEYKTLVVSEKLENLPMLRKQLVDLKYSGVVIYDAPYFYEAITGRIPVKQIKESFFLFRNQGESFNPYVSRNIKIIFDKLLALSGIILSLPFMFVGTIAIKLTSKGKVFFKQERLGENERPFILLKFRTMVDNAEKENGPQWACENDQRITKIGKFLRKTHLDELPQLFNILKGDMSFVGPRPIRKHFSDMLAKNIPHYRLRFVVKPGLTGWAQVKGDYAGSEKGQSEKLEYDLYYIQNQSIFFDLYIVLNTMKTVLFRRGQ